MKQIRKFFSTLNFGKKIGAERNTPILDELVRQNINYGDLKKFLDKYAHVLIKGSAFEMHSLHGSNKFADITNTTEALNQGHQCLYSFIKRLYTEYDEYIASKGSTDVWEQELELGIDNEK